MHARWLYSPRPEHGTVLHHVPSSSQTPSRDGYWFEHLNDDIALVRDGRQVRLARLQPPWLVVDQTIATLIVSSGWPGRLWRARVTELGDMSGLVANPGYWRAAAMELLEELPLSVLFGAHGERVVALLEQIQALSRTQAECLAANLDPTPATPTAGPGCAGPRRKGSSGPRRRTTGKARWPRPARAARTNRPFIPVSCWFMTSCAVARWRSTAIRPS